MPILRGKITAAASAISTQLLIDTNLTPDSTSGWQILGLKLLIPDFYTVAVDARVALVLTKLLNVGTGNNQTLPNSSNELARAELAIASVGTAASATQVWNEALATIMGDRITVQPNLYLNVDNIAGVNSMDCYWELEYEVIKLNNNEVLRMLVEGA